MSTSPELTDRADRQSGAKTQSFNAISVGLFALTFAIVASALSLTLRAMEPKPDFLVLSPKLDFYSQNHTEFNTVFLGTSRTFYHIVPDVVEASAERAGCPGLSVYNFGVFGLNGAEQDWLIDRVLEIGGSELDLLIIEDPLPAERTLDDVTSERARYFHQPAQYDAYLEDIFSFPESTPKRLFRSGVFGYGAAYDLSGVGRLSKALFPEAEPNAPHGFDFSNDGFEALGSRPTADIEARKADFDANPETFFDNLSKYELGPEADPTTRAKYHLRKLDGIEKAGVRGALFISPDTAEVRRTPWVADALSEMRPDALTLNFNHPEDEPDLFQRGLWFDFHHLNEDGAERLSAKVGAQICASSKATG